MQAMRALVLDTDVTAGIKATLQALGPICDVIHNIEADRQVPTKYPWCRSTSCNADAMTCGTLLKHGASCHNIACNGARKLLAIHVAV